MNYKEVIDKGTSVKTIHVIKEPHAVGIGEADFRVRPQYSVFDWGAMPIPEGKEMDNRTLVVVSAYNFEMLERNRIPTHYLGMVDGEGNRLNWDHVRKGKIPLGIRAKYVNIIKPKFVDGQYDYSEFQNPPVNNYVEPLEFIFRNELPPESSLGKAFRREEVPPEAFGLPSDFNPEDELPFPVLDYTSKFEAKDRRYLPERARILAGISHKRWAAINESSSETNRLLTEHAREIGFDHPDGKLEYIRVADCDQIADFVGTWHEDRWIYMLDGKIPVKVSKQTPRDFNKLLNPKWAEQCESAPKQAEMQGVEDWKQLVTVQPEPLEPEFFDHYNNLMRAATNTWIGFTVFPESSPMDEAAREAQVYFKDYKSRLEK